jgi:hypothetical protein
LEALGVLLPFVTRPGSLKGQHVVFTVDNIAVVFGWDSRSVKFDDMATIILRAVHLISLYLGCTVHIMHSPRRTSKWEVLVDNLSRMSSRSAADRNLVRQAEKSKVSGALARWLNNPKEGWELPYILLREVKKIA